MFCFFCFLNKCLYVIYMFSELFSKLVVYDDLLIIIGVDK